MKNIMTLTVAAACTLVLTACGGGGDSDDNSNALSRADEGIWGNDPNDTTTDALQVVILNDGSYWSIDGSGFHDGVFSRIKLISHGTASIDGKNVSGAYFKFTGSDGGSQDISYGNGAYTGTASTQNNLRLIFNDPSVYGGNFSMNYDGVYNQPASLATIEGNYLPGGVYAPVSWPPNVPFPSQWITPDHPNLTISGSTLTLYNGNGEVAMTGAITPHGTMVNVFDVSLTSDSANPMANKTWAGATVGISAPSAITPPITFNGILFQTSAGRSNNYIEVVATAGNSAAFYFLGSKQD
jgi:hypothetical protein